MKPLITLFDPQEHEMVQISDLLSRVLIQCIRVDGRSLILITLPVCKDSAFLKHTSEVLEDFVPTVSSEFKLLIAEDGSNSSQIVADLKEKFPNVIYVQHDERLGRGRALREAWRNVEADVYVYVDVDLATDLKKFDAFRKLISLQGQFDLVTGSRYLEGAVTERPFLRRSSSILYNGLVRLLFDTGIHDHQCGFKSFSRSLVKVLSKEAKADSWFWDTEVIVIAKRLGFRITEIPVYWTEQKGRRTPLARLFKDMWLHGVGLLKLTWRIYTATLK